MVSWQYVLIFWRRARTWAKVSWPCTAADDTSAFLWPQCWLGVNVVQPKLPQCRQPRPFFIMQSPSQPLSVATAENHPEVRPVLAWTTAVQWNFYAYLFVEALIEIPGLCNLGWLDGWTTIRFWGCYTADSERSIDSWTAWGHESWNPFFSPTCWKSLVSLCGWMSSLEHRAS